MKYSSKIKGIQSLSLYVIFNALNGAIPFFLLPVITKFLDPESYGTLAIFQTTMAALIPIVGLSLGFKIDKEFFKLDKFNLGVDIFNILSVIITAIIAVTVLIYIVVIKMAYDLVDLPRIWLVSLPLLSASSCVVSFNLILLRNQEKVREYGLWQIGLTLLNLGSSLVFVICFSLDWQGRALGISIANFIVAIASLARMQKTGYIVLRFEWNRYKQILGFSLPLLFYGVSIFIMHQANILLMDLFVEKSQVGIYSVAMAFAALTGLVKEGIVKTFNPWLYKSLAQKSSHVKMRSIVGKIMLISLGLIVLAFIINLVSSYLIIHIVDSAYYSAQSLVLLLSLSISINGIYNIIVPFYINNSNTKILSLISVLSAILSLILNYYLIQKYGNTGAAYALLLSLTGQLLFALLFLPLNKKLLK